MSSDNKLLQKVYLMYLPYPASIGFLVPVYFVLAERGYTFELVGLLMLMYRLAYYGGDLFISMLADVAMRRTALFISSMLVFAGVLMLDVTLYSGLLYGWLLTVAFLLMGVGQKAFERVFRVYVTDMHEAGLVGKGLGDVFSTIGVLASSSSAIAILASSLITYYVTFHFSVVSALLLIIFIMGGVLLLEEPPKSGVSGGLREPRLREALMFLRGSPLLSVAIMSFSAFFTAASLLAEVGYQLVFTEINVPGIFFGVGLLVISLARGGGAALAKTLLKVFEEEKAFFYLSLVATILPLLPLLQREIFTLTAVAWCVVAYAITPVVRAIILRTLPARVRATLSSIYGMLAIAGTVLASSLVAWNRIVEGFVLVSICLLTSATCMVRSQPTR